APFISSLPLPLTTVRFSAAVCQCQGTEQPEVNLARITAGPLLGSPRCVESVIQAGNPGRSANLEAGIGVTPRLSSLIAAKPIHAISPAIMVIFRNKCILFFSSIPQYEGQFAGNCTAYGLRMVDAKSASRPSYCLPYTTEVEWSCIRWRNPSRR